MLKFVLLQHKYLLIRQYLIELLSFLMYSNHLLHRMFLHPVLNKQRLTTEILQKYLNQMKLIYRNIFPSIGKLSFHKNDSLRLLVAPLLKLIQIKLDHYLVQKYQMLITSHQQHLVKFVHPSYCQIEPYVWLTQQ